jgi:mono/diheme cytochrome c family protein
MRAEATLLLFLALGAAACRDPRRSMSEFKPAPGDPAHGREVFLEMRCFACHRVAGEDLPAPVAQPAVPVVLGGRITHALPDGALADAIANPSHHVRWTEPGVPSGALSRMPDYTDVLTVRELSDLVAYLQTRYDVIPPPAARF